MKAYIKRNEEGAIVFYSAGPQPDMDLEEVDEQSPDVVAFLNRPATGQVTIVYQVDLWSRMTDAEAEAVMAAMAAQPIRIQNIFRSAGEYQSTHELWPLLQTVAAELFGTDRAAELLAPSTPPIIQG